MNPITLSVIAFVCILVGSLVGILLRHMLPEHHLSSDAKDVVRLGAGLIGTIAALVLGLLIASAKTSFDTQASDVKQLTANVILLDQLLAQYGPEAATVRHLLRRAVDAAADRIWHEGSSVSARNASFEATAAGEGFIAKLHQLSPQTDNQRSLRDRAIQVSTDIARARLLLFTQGDNPIAMPFLIVLIFWVSIIFANFSLFAEPKPIVIGALVVFALSAAAAIFLVLELGQPFSGVLQISSIPFRSALAPL
ncbi:MAG: hypothetical protein ACM3IH_16205 [Sphingobacteriales bacterium]|jgi:hypothetical protein